MIIKPHHYQYNAEHEIIVICGENTFLIDYILSKLKKYINPFYGYKYVYSIKNTHDSHVIVRNSNKWNNISKIKQYIYIPCYDWNIESTMFILDGMNINLIKYIHYYSCMNMIDIFHILSIEEIESIIQNTTISIRNEQIVYDDIMDVISQ